MKKGIVEIIIGVLLIVCLVLAGIILVPMFSNRASFPTPTPLTETNNSSANNNQTNIANPASVFCEKQGNKLEIRTDPSTGGQVGICIFPNKAECEEWAYFRDECPVNLEKDTAAIKQALINEDRNLFGMKVTISKDTGRYAKGSVSPIAQAAGGGMVFAAKENGEWKIVFDGNGQIDCTLLDPYPNFPADMITDCVNSQGLTIRR